MTSVAVVTTTLCLTTILTPVLYQIWKSIGDIRKRGRAVDKFPGEPKHWLWGHLHLIPGPNEAGLSFMRSMIAIYPRAQKLFFGFMFPVVALRHPECMAEVLRGSEPKPMTLGYYRLGKSWIGDGLLVSSGRKWARNRRLLTPAFHFDILKPYVKVNNEAANILLNKLGKAAEERQLFEFFSNVALTTFDVILRCAFSYEDDVQIKGSPWLYYDFVYNLTPSGRKFRKHCKFVHSISENIIQSRRKIINEQGEDALRKGRYLDFLDILLTAKDDEDKGLTDQEIRDEVDTFLFEGHDTTASSISWAVYSLAGHPDVQERVQQEIDAVLDGRDSDEIEWDDLPKLKYLTMCIKESMRLHCPVPFIQRQLTKETTIDGISLPKGSIVDIQIYHLHHNPTVWSEPEEFRPERFLPENIEKMDSFAFVPFSAGPRFTFSLDPDVAIEKKLSVVMKTQNGMPLRVALRNGSVE